MTITFPKICARCVKYFSSDLGLKTQNFTKNVGAHWQFSHPEKLQFLKANISFSFTRNELNNSPIKFHKPFNSPRQVVC